MIQSGKAPAHEPVLQLEEWTDSACVIRTRGGQLLNTALDRWNFTEGVVTVSINFAQLQGLSKDLVASAKATLAWYAENRSANHVKNLFARLLHFVRHIASDARVLHQITAADLLNFRSSLSHATAWYFGALSGLFKKWHGLGCPGVDPDSLSLLHQVATRGNAKGVAVMTHDPVRGPFTPLEAESLQAALNRAYGTGALQTSDYVLAWLFILLGQRSIQYAALKVCDVKSLEVNAGEIERYWIMMPSGKRRLVSPRARLVERPLFEQFGQVLVEYARSVRSEFSGVLEDPDQAPLFPNREATNSLDGFRYHPQPKHITRRIKAITESLGATSERTGEPIAVTGGRFRSTIATRAAEEGHGPLVIAALLDHTDTQNVGVYTASTPAIIDRIDRAVAMELAPLAQAFAGVLVEPEGRSIDPKRRIIDLRIDRSGAAMGQCGQHGFCGFSAPIACYTCSNFEAWPDGPHEAVLHQLLERRERLLQTSDKRMASINDRTILAVAAVIQLCDERNNGNGRAIDG